MIKIGSDLYRQLLVQAKRLPDQTAAAFYRSQIRDSFRQQPSVETSRDAVKRVQRANKLLRQLTAANDGYLHALTRALNAAYGRTGSAKHRALQPFLPPNHLPQPTTFSPLLSTLLQSPVAHTARPPTPAHLRSPPSLPPRAVPGSEAARLLGQLPLQRERAVRGRYWREQVGKLRAPVAVSVARSGAGPGEDGGKLGREVVEEALRAMGIRMSVERLESGRELLRALEERTQVRAEDQPLLPRRLRAATLSITQDAAPPPFPPHPTPPKPKPQRKEPATHPPQMHSSKWHNPKVVTARLLRNRLAGILHGAPIVAVAVPVSDDARGRLASPPKVSVVRSGWARGGLERHSLLGEEGEWWLATYGEEGGKKTGRGKGEGPQAAGDVGGDLEGDQGRAQEQD